MAAIVSKWSDPVGWALFLWGGLVASLGFPPAEVWPLTLIAPAPLWAVCLKRPRGQAFRRGWLYGLGFFGALLWWIVPTVVRYGGLPWVAGGACLAALAAYLALYPALSALWVSWVGEHRPGLAVALAPAAWTGIEALRGAALSGFPWGDLPQALWAWGPALDAAPWVGMVGVRFFQASVASAAAWVIARTLLSVRVPIAALAAPLCAVGAWATLVAVGSPLPVPKGELRAAVVQGNIDQAVKWDARRRREIVATYSGLTRSTLDQRPQLVLWPETAVPFYAQDPSGERGVLEALAGEMGAHLAFGAPAYERRGGGEEYRNALFLMSPSGAVVGRYDKFHLVPFGEYVPLGRYLPFVKKLVTGAGDFTPGPAVRPLPPVESLPRFGPLVCFEVIFPSVAAQHVAGGAECLLVVTNDAWFGRTPGPYQHLAFVPWRAAELGVPAIRAANTGISAVFDARGRLVRRTDLLRAEAVTVRVAYPHAPVTPYLRGGRWFPVASAALACLPLFAILRGPRGAGVSGRAAKTGNAGKERET